MAVKDEKLATIVYDNFVSTFLEMLTKATEHVDAKSEFMIVVDGVCQTVAVASQEASSKLDADANTLKSASRYKVYVKPGRLKSDDVNSAFYCKSKEKNGNTVVGSVVNTIVRKLTSNRVGPFTLANSSIYNVSIKVDSSLKIIVLQSEIYQTLRAAAEEDKSFETFTINEEQIDPKVAHAALEYFKQESYSVYRNLLNSLKQKFNNRLLSSTCRKFYQIEHTYVLILVDYAYVYNPLRAPLIRRTLDRTKLMEYARSQDRRHLHLDDVDGNAILSGYLLTSAEISRLTGLKKMFRFNQQIFYDLLVGKLDSSLPGFPSPNQSCFIRITNDIGEYTEQTKAMYTEIEYKQEMQTLSMCAHDGQNDKSVRDLAQKKFDYLAGYKQANTLGYYLGKNLTKITRLTPSYLNPKNMKASTLYEIVEPFSLT